MIDIQPAVQHPLWFVCSNNECTFLTSTIRLVMSTRIITTPIGYCLVAAAPFVKGDTILNITGVQTPVKDRYSIQLAVDTHLMPFDADTVEAQAEQCPWMFTNHSCDPNVVIRDQMFIALRSIEPDEAITFDYETTEWEMAEPFQCACGAESCRGEIRGYTYLDSSERERLIEQTASHLRDLIQP